MDPSNARRPSRPPGVAWIGLLALGASPALAVSPLEAGRSVHAELPVGPPAPALHRDASRQLALSANPRLRALASRWGGAWAWRFDERSGRPYSAALPGVSWKHVDALVDDLRATLGPDITLREVREAQSGERWFLVYEQVHDGLPLYGTELALFALSGRVQAVRTAVVPPPRRSAPAGAELWFPVDDGAHVQYEPAVWIEAGDIVRIVHAEDGRELAAWSLRHYATVELQHDERNPGSAILTSPLVDGAVDDGSGVQYTDSAGVHTASDPYDLELAGERLRIQDFAEGGGPVPRFEGIEGDRELTVGGEGDLRFAVADGWHHTKVVEAWLESRNPDHAILDIQVQALMNRGDFRCNAFYTGGTINFARKSGSCANTGRLADVIYHEFGHGVHHYGLLAGTFAGDLSEGTADYISATILDDPRVGLGFFSDTRSLRDVSIDRIYPDNFRGQVHNDGRIWGSFLWNLRESWQQVYGEEAGAERVDTLMLAAMATGPRLTTVGDAVILADDDDGDLSNGTPHACELVELLDQHGLGPGPIGVVSLEHEPLDQVGSFETGYPVSFGLYDALKDCSGLDRSTVALWFTADATTIDDAIDPFVEGEGEEAVAAVGPTYTSTGGATWTRLELTEEGSEYDGVLPRQLATTQVTYFIEARSTDGAERITSHDGASEALYRFRVGDMEAVWCEDFEDLDAPVDPSADLSGEDTDGTDDTDPVELEHGGWEAGAGTPWEEASGSWVNQWSFDAVPEEGLFSPTEAWSGEKVAGTALGELYRNRNVQYLRSPPMAVPEDGRMPLITFRRWLTVEDAEYDKARLFVDDAQVWQQARTEGGRSHTLDTRWVRFELDAEDLRGTEPRLTWTLRSDPGLEFGGWALDEVCVERLADLPAHHRVVDLELTVDEEDHVTATWSNPWIAPLDEVVVVRTRGGLPTGRDVGVWVFDDTAPEPTVAHELVDAQTEPCTTYGYAVLVRGDGVWYEAVVDGDNAGTVRTACVDGPDVELPDPVDPSVDGEVGAVDAYRLPEIEGCGCQAPLRGPATGAWLALLGLVLLRRRKR